MTERPSPARDPEEGSDDPAHLDEFVKALTDHQEELFLVIRSFCGDPDIAADIRQAVNIVLWKKRAKFELGTSFRAWAFRIAQLETRAYFRKRKKEDWVGFGPELMETLTTELEEASPRLKDRKQALRTCLRKLTPKDTELIRHRYWKKGTLDSLAENTNRSVGTLKARLHQLRTGLRRCVNQELAKR